MKPSDLDKRQKQADGLSTLINALGDNFEKLSPKTGKWAKMNRGFPVKSKESLKRLTDFSLAHDYNALSDAFDLVILVMTSMYFTVHKKSADQTIKYVRQFFDSQTEKGRSAKKEKAPAEPSLSLRSVASTSLRRDRSTTSRYALCPIFKRDAKKSS